jgi:hypothetical protein
LGLIARVGAELQATSRPRRGWTKARQEPSLAGMLPFVDVDVIEVE